MIRIELITLISAPRERCFDLARSIDLHLVSTEGTGERAIAGVTSGLIGAGQEVAWRGWHLGLPVSHRSRITQYQRPQHFQDCMVKGSFRSFCHDHHFEEVQADRTRMTDVMEFSAPFGVVGRMVEKVLLRRHMLQLLLRRNECLRRTAEGDAWKRYLS
jgi:ligand-binding SRPBCC domain-containing protein